MKTKQGVCRTLRAQLCLAFVCAAAACGGGGGGGGGGGAPSAPEAVGQYGDSFGSGYGLAVSPAQRLRELTGRPVTDYARNAATTSEALGQIPAPANATPLPYAVPLTTWITRAPEPIAEIRFGPADAGLGVALEQFESNLDLITAAATAAGKRVVLVGVDDRWPAFDTAIRDVAARHAAVYVRVADIPVTTFDGTHPDQATSDAVSAVIANAVGRAP